MARRQVTSQMPARQVSCFRRGLLLITVQLVQGRSLPLGQFLPESWPNELVAAAPFKAAVAQTHARKTYP